MPTTKSPPAAPEHLDALGLGIRAELVLVEVAYERMVDSALRCGDLLIEAKAQLPHGEWKPWLRENFWIVDRHSGRREKRGYHTAVSYMRLARKRAEVERAQPSSLRTAFSILKGATDPPPFVRYPNPHPVNIYVSSLDVTMRERRAAGVPLYEPWQQWDVHRDAGRNGEQTRVYLGPPRRWRRCEHCAFHGAPGDSDAGCARCAGTGWERNPEALAASRSSGPPAGA